MKLRWLWWVLKGLLTIVLAAASLYVMIQPLYTLAMGGGKTDTTDLGAPVKAAIVSRYDMFINNRFASALEGVLAVEKVYWLSDQDIVAPEPDQSKYTTCATSEELAAFLQAAEGVLEGQSTLITPMTPLAPNTVAQCYLDETIMAVTWKQVIDGGIYTISEVKIKHPSQFRRFLSGGSYGSGIQLTTSDMAASVNAVVASSGDFYAFRPLGVTVYEGIVRRGADNDVDTCYIDDKGNLLFSYRGQFGSNAEIQQFVDENNIRFSLSFGPVLVEDGQEVTLPRIYAIGEINDTYARAALAQLDDLHYLTLAVNAEFGYSSTPTIRRLQVQLMNFGVRHGYTLDGGQTAVVVMNDKVINRVVYNAQRKVSDIIYFATAVPDTRAAQ